MDRAQSFLGARSPWSVSTTGAPTYWAGPRHAVLRARRPRPLRPGLQRLVPRRRHAATADRRRSEQPPAHPGRPSTRAGGDGRRGRRPTPLRARASGTEVLRHRDIAELQPGRAGAPGRAVRAAAPAHPDAPGPAPRVAWHRGEIDADRTLRRMLRADGRAGRDRVAAAATAPAPPGRAAGRRVRLDEPVRRRAAAARARFGRAGATHGARGRVETFTIGTRLTRVTRALRAARPRPRDRRGRPARSPTGPAAPGWARPCRSSCDRWGQRGLARGAVVVIFSDGWERGDTDLLAE